MSQPIELVRLEPQNVLVVRRTIASSGVGEFFIATYPRVVAELLAQGATIASMPFSRFHKRDPTAFDVEAGVAFTGSVSPPAWAQVTQLPGGEAAKTTHIGPYETLAQEYPGLEAWLIEHGKRLGPSPWVVYVDNDEVTPPERLRTDVFWPVA